MNLQISKEIFNPVYLPFVNDYELRYEVYYGGAGSGKSVFLAQKILVKALCDKRKILCARKVGRTVKNSIFQLFIDLLLDWKILRFCKVNRTDFTIELPNGSVILCTGVDDVEKLKSITGLTDAWLEEASEFSQDDFNQIDLRIRHASAVGQQIYLSFNPVSKVNWCYSLFFADNASFDSFRRGCRIIHTTYKDNKFLPQSYIDSLLKLKNTNSTYYKIYALGEFGSLSKLVFENWEIGTAAEDGELLVGLDFGFVNDPTAITVALLNEKEKTIYVKNEYFGKGLLNDGIYKKLSEMGLSKSLIIADSAEQKSIEEIRRLGAARIRSAAKGQGSILQGIQKLQQYRIIINPACSNLIEEFQNYSWEKDKQTNEYINKPVDKYNHGIDALRYSLQCVGKNIRVMDKALLGL